MSGLVFLRPAKGAAAGSGGGHSWDGAKRNGGGGGGGGYTQSGTGLWELYDLLLLLPPRTTHPPPRSQHQRNILNTTQLSCKKHHTNVYLYRSCTIYQSSTILPPIFYPLQKEPNLQHKRTAKVLPAVHPDQSCRNYSNRTVRPLKDPTFLSKEVCSHWREQLFWVSLILTFKFVRRRLSNVHPAPHRQNPPQITPPSHWSPHRPVRTYDFHPTLNITFRLV